MICIGYWGWHSEQPIPDTACHDQDEIISKLKNALANGFLESYRGSSNCRLCGKQNGWRELKVIKGSKTYLVPEGYLHYLEDHRVGYDVRLLDIL